MSELMKLTKQELVDKITELKSGANEFSRKESFMEKAIEKLEENK